MSEHLILRLSEPPVAATAVVMTSDGRLSRAAAHVPLTTAAALAEGRTVSVLVPCDRAVVLAAEVPKASAARMRNLLPFSLEDHFATDIDDLHFASGARLPDGRIMAAVTDREQMSQWLDALRAAGIEPDGMYAECDGVPDTPSTTVLLVEGPFVLGRKPGEPPFRLESLALDEILTLLGEQAGEGSDVQHVMIYGSSAALEERAAEIHALRAAIADVDVRDIRDGATALLAAKIVGRGATNLLQSDYAPRSDLLESARPWLPAAGIAAGLLLLTVIGLAIDVFRLDRANDALTARTEEICSQQFGTPLPSACRAEAQRRLAAAGQSASSADVSFLQVLGAIADSDGSTSIEAMSYRNRTLDIDMTVPDVEALDEFSRRVADSRMFEVRPLSNTPQDDGLRSRVQVVTAP